MTAGRLDAGGVWDLEDDERHYAAIHRLQKTVCPNRTSKRA